jgi:hypothetical protein
MKKATIISMCAVLILSGCGTMGTGAGSSAGSSTGSILGSVLGAATNGETLGNILGSVLGMNKVSQRELVNSWYYDGPGCAFTSESALARAGGEVAATKVEQELQQYYSKLGVSRSNTYFTFNQNGRFQAKVDGKSWSGTYSYNEKDGSIQLQGLLLKLNGYVQRNGSGISLLFESKKVLSLFQTLAAISGNSTIGTIGDISKNYDGVRIGFDLKH